MLPDDRYRRAAAAGGVGIWDWNIVTGEVYIDRVLKETARLPGRRDRQHGGRLAPAGASRRQGGVGRMDPGPYCRRSSPIRVRASDASSRRQRPMVPRACVRDTRRAGAAVHLAGTDTDITARKRGEEALRQAEEINRRIAESTGDCVKILDLDGRLLYINPEGLRQLELDDASALLNAPLEGPLEGEARHAAQEAIERRVEAARAASRSRFEPGQASRWFDIVADADHRCERRRRPAARGLARYHRTTPGGGVSRHPAPGARDDRHRQRPG